MGSLSGFPSTIFPLKYYPKSSYSFLPQPHAPSGMMFLTCPDHLGALDMSAPSGDPLSSHPAKAYGPTHGFRFQVLMVILSSAIPYLFSKKP